MVRFGFRPLIPCIIAAVLLPCVHAVAQPAGAEIEAFGLRQGGDTDESVVLRVRSEPTGRMAPLLPYVFFDEGSATLPARFTGTDVAVTSDRFVRAYRTVLTVLAARMAEWPTDTLVLTGTRSRTERAGADLGRRRAEAVAAALAERGVDRRRIVVRSADRPATPSSERHEQGSAENRRVELTGSARLLAPIALVDSSMEVESPGLRLVPDLLRPVSSTASWRIELRHAGKLFRRLSGRAPVPEAIDESFSESELRWLAETGPAVIELLFVVTDGNDSIVARPRAIPLRIERARRALRASEGRPQDRETVVLFGFDSAEPMPGSDAVLEDLLARLGSDDRLSLVGFTDETGSPEHNLALSQRRADAVAARLGTRVSHLHAAGESGGLHWNTTPEDRFYSRVVRITVGQ